MCAESLGGHGGPAFCEPVLTGRGWVWQAARVETESISVGELLNDPANVRQHGARNLETIKASLARFGQQKPIVVDGNGVVVAGNGTLAAARELGWQSVHVVRSGLTGSDRTAYAIADNRTAELAEWDEGALAEQLSALAIDDAELLAAAGYDPGELEALADAVVGGGDVVEDEAPEPPADPVTKPGDLWQLGEHRVLCGDSTKAEDVARLMGGQVADTLLTDPPYGMALDTDYTGFAVVDGLDSQVYEPVEGDSVEFDPRPTLELFDKAAEVFMWGADYFYPRLPSGGSWMVWDKRTPESDGILGNHFEVLWSKRKHRRRMIRHHWCGVTARNSDQRRSHPTEKPIGLLVEIIKDHGGQLIADPFLGSGTTLIAAEQLGRKCYGVEISPAYCDVIVERWENLTGGKAKRVTDG
jgi:hypothetical protein